MPRVILVIWSVLCFTSSLNAGVRANPDSARLSEWAFDILNIPVLTPKNDEKLLIAVVDDGFLLEHNSLSGFIYTNEKEIPGNLIDDDQNGYIDDIHGWDISDHDNNTGLLPDLKATHYHGTYVASLVTGVLIRSFGDVARQQVSILPVKVLSDRAETTAIRDGFQGIEYAVMMGADIICTAWSGGAPTPERNNILSRALEEDILIIGSAGNTKKETVEFPASVSGVLAIAALDSSLHRQKDSNFGEQIDLSLPGAFVKGAHPDAVNAWVYSGKTSAAAGLAVGCAAVLQAIQPRSSSVEIIEALKNTATPLDSINLRFCGKLGAGIPDLQKAVNYLVNEKNRIKYFNDRRPEGWIYINSAANRYKWPITPYGAYKGIRLNAEFYSPKDRNKTIQILTGDSTVINPTISSLRAGITIPGSSAILQLAGRKHKHIPDQLKLNYHMETIDSTTLYCKGEVSIESSSGVITDNSGSNNYANNCACIWRIHAPDKKELHIRFTRFDTEAKVDFVWLFDGTETHPDNIIAKFSGPDIPPEITSRTNLVTVWFVTDDQHTADGWELHFEGR